MPANDKVVLVYATFPTPESAEEVGAALVEQGLAACVNILPGMVSIYSWQGTRHRDTEAVMVIKTRQALAERVIQETQRRHPYENPALLVLPVEAGASAFLAWIREQTSDQDTGK